ncbi:MAG: dodecin family protein [Candidatus Bathyarchaeia archaeon]
MVFKFVEIIGTSGKSFDDAVRNALSEASETVRAIKWLEVIRYGAVVKKEKIAEYQATVKIAFQVER